MESRRAPRLRARPALAAACLALLLAACASGRVPRVPELPMPAAYDAAGRAALPPAALDAWWTTFDDPQLQALVDRALAEGLDARAALARLEEARAIRGQALSAYAPQGAVQGSTERTRSRNLDDGPDPVDAEAQALSLPVSWELDLFGRRAAARAAADADLAAARFGYEAARAALAAQVAQTLFEARGLAAQRDDARENARIQRALLALLQRRVERGLAAAADADRVAAELALADARLLALEAELHGARRALLVLLGDGLAPLDAMPVDAALGAPPPVPAQLPADLLVRRPDVREARARIDAAAGAVRLAERAFFPRITLQPALGASRQRGPVDSTLSFWTLGAGLSVPVLDRPRLQAALAMEGARGDQAVVAYEQAVQAAFADADRAFAALAAARGQVDLLADGEARARRAFDAADVRYRRGLGDLQALLDAESAWRATRSALTAARRDALLGAVAAFKALGGGWTAPAPSPDDASTP